MGLNKCTHTKVNEQLNLGKFCFKKKKVSLFWGGIMLLMLFFFPFCYPAYAALVNAQWVPSIKHLNVFMKHLDYLILQESKNRPNVFCCERFVETK